MSRTVIQPSTSVEDADKMFIDFEQSMNDENGKPTGQAIQYRTDPNPLNDNPPADNRNSFHDIFPDVAFAIDNNHEPAYVQVQVQRFSDGQKSGWLSFADATAFANGAQ